jgi:hypothetical protein
MTCHAMSARPYSVQVAEARHQVQHEVLLERVLDLEDSPSTTAPPFTACPTPTSGAWQILLSTSWDAIQLKRRGLLTNIARHVIGCHIDSETRVHNVLDDVAGSICLATYTTAPPARARQITARHVRGCRLVEEARIANACH